jgi:hypothetical protein
MNTAVFLSCRISLPRGTKCINNERYLFGIDPEQRTFFHNHHRHHHQCQSFRFPHMMIRIPISIKRVTVTKWSRLRDRSNKVCRDTSAHVAVWHCRGLHAVMSTDQSPSEENSRSIRQEIHSLLWNTDVPCRVTIATADNCPKIVTSHIVFIIQYCLLRMPEVPSGCFASVFLTKILHVFLLPWGTR